ncbi:polymorphic toxin type 15 domain-containing protein [Methylobacterium indicum]|nr:polymorphic toxin type 15 domain-containing protein [Methylobacterium indicum]
MPWVDEVPRDDFERALFAKARELEAQGVDRDEILKWFRGEGVAHAKTKAKSDSDAQAKTQASRRSGTVRVTQTRIRCYKLDKHLTGDKKKDEVFIKEFCRQLREQEAAVNKMTREEWENARQHFKNNKRDGSEIDYRNNERQRLIKNYIQKNNMSPAEARIRANNEIENLAPLHVPDQVIGGNLSTITRMGDRLVNSIIGGGWPSRIAEFERHAKSLKPDEKMSIELCATVKGQDACGESNKYSKKEQL